MDAIESQITSFTIVYSTVYSDADQRKHQSSASLAFVWGIHRWPVNSPHKWPVTRKMFPFDDVIMYSDISYHNLAHLQIIVQHHYSSSGLAQLAYVSCVSWNKLFIKTFTIYQSHFNRFWISCGHQKDTLTQSPPQAIENSGYFWAYMIHFRPQPTWSVKWLQSITGHTSF